VIAEMRGQECLSATTAQTCLPQILAFVRTGITNTGSEGTNWAIKTVGRDAYGFRDPVNQAAMHLLRHHSANPRSP
jgi:transposase